MASHTVDKALLKRIFNQLSGKIKESDELVPEVAIKGRGHLWCYDPTQKQVILIARGIKCYILNSIKDDLERILVYTTANNVILIEESELIYTGFD